jgi:hypothetical protein
MVDNKQTLLTGYTLNNVEKEANKTIDAALDLYETGFVSKHELHWRLEKAKEAFLGFSQ